MVPDAIGATEPTPVSMVNVVAFVVVHERTDEAPVTIEAGAAISVHVGAAGGGGITGYVHVTPAWLVADEL